MSDFLFPLEQAIADTIPGDILGGNVNLSKLTIDRTAISRTEFLFLLETLPELRELDVCITTGLRSFDQQWSLRPTKQDE